MFNLDVEKYFKISNDLVSFYAKLFDKANDPALAEESFENEISSSEQNINKLHVLLFEIYSEIINDTFIFICFVSIVKLLRDRNKELKKLINIESFGADFSALYILGFIFKKIKKYINQRENDLAQNLEKIIIITIEELESAFLYTNIKAPAEAEEPINKGNDENIINKENAKVKYAEFLSTKDLILAELMTIFNKIYFEIFDFKLKNLRNINTLERIDNIRLRLANIEEPFFYGLFENKTKENFFSFLNQFEFYINLINKNLQHTPSNIFNDIFISVNNINEEGINKSIKTINVPSEKGEDRADQNENIKENKYELINSDFLIVNYMRINILESGKYII